MRKHTRNVVIDAILFLCLLVLLGVAGYRNYHVCDTAAGKSWKSIYQFIATRLGGYSFLGCSNIYGNNFHTFGTALCMDREQLQSF